MVATKVIKDVKGMIDTNLKQMASIYERFDYKKYNRYDAVSIIQIIYQKKMLK